MIGTAIGQASAASAIIPAESPEQPAVAVSSVPCVYCRTPIPAECDDRPDEHVVTRYREELLIASPGGRHAHRAGVDVPAAARDALETEFGADNRWWPL